MAGCFLDDFFYIFTRAMFTRLVQQEGATIHFHHDVRELWQSEGSRGRPERWPRA